jgi:hypothetical protein
MERGHHVQITNEDPRTFLLCRVRLAGEALLLRVGRCVLDLSLGEVPCSDRDENSKEDERRSNGYVNEGIPSPF